MSKRASKTAKAATVHIDAVAYIADGGARNALSLAMDLPATTAADRAAAEAALVSAASSELAADVAATGAAWKTAEAVAGLYRALLGAGKTDAETWAEVCGWNGDAAKRGALARAYGGGAEKNRVNYTGKAGRGIALGVARDDGETLKEYASRVGGVKASRKGAGGANPESAKARAAAAKRVASALASARKDAAQAGPEYFGAAVLASLEKTANAVTAAIEKHGAAKAASADA